MATPPFIPRPGELNGDGHDRSPRRRPADVETAYTDRCAELLALEAERLRVKRRLTAALIESSNDPQAAQRLWLLARQENSLRQQIDAGQRELRQLRNALESPPAGSQRS